MSWEAWGTPPDQEPELCPICDNTQHTPEKCEVAASEAHSRAHYEGVIALLLQDKERQLTNAYADGRKDEREEWLPVLVELRECQAALSSLLGNDPNLISRVCGSTTLGNRLVHVRAAIGKAAGGQQ